MKPVLEQKLRELIVEADRQVAPAVSTVLQLLLTAYLDGKQNDFAKHCCRLSPIVITGMAMKTPNEAEDGWADAVSGTFVH